MGGPPGADAEQPPFSVVILARAAESTIESCLASVAGCPEVLVCLDDSVGDETERLAEMAGARVEHVEWLGGFATQRNVAAGLATHDWILFVDADEEATPELLTELRALLIR